MCKKRTGQLLALSLLALALTACGQKGDLFLPESEQAEKAVPEEPTPEEPTPEEKAPNEQDPKEGPIMETEQLPEKDNAEQQGEQP